MNKLLCAMVSVTVSVASLGVSATEIFVACDDPNAADTAGEGRGSEELPYATILAAVNAANDDESITRVWVKPGVYTNGTVNMGAKSSTDADWNNLNLARAIIKRPFRLEATGSAADTEIRGHLGSLGLGCGSGAIRCLQVNAAGAGAVVKGFTLANGATREDHNGGWGELGGGVFAETEGVYIVDCVFTNCCGRKGSALRGGTAIRCYFKKNLLYSGDSGFASDARLWFCYVYQASDAANYSLFNDSACKSVNTTFFLYSKSFAAAAGCSFSNCLFTRPTGLTISGTATDCVNNLKSRDLANPYLAEPDLRLLSTSSATNAAKVANIRSVFTVPDEFSATDFYGNAINYAATDCNAGACQVTVTTPYGGIGGRSSALYIDGNYVPDGGYIFATEYPHVFKVSGTSSLPIHYMSGKRMNADGTASADAEFQVYPWAEDFPVAAPYASGKVYGFWVAGANDCLWVDQNSESATEDGTVANPYKTIQGAVTNCQAAKTSSKYSIIYVKPGDYAGGLDSKVQSGSYCQLRAVGSKEETIIRGSEGVRCAFNFTLVRGFTLTGASNALSGAVAGSCTITDCVVSNNVSTSSHLFNSCSINRCLITGNTTPASLVRLGGANSSLIYGNSCNRLFNGDSEVLFCCTAADNVIADTAALGNPVSCFNTIIEAGGKSSGTRTDSYSNLVWNTTSYAANWICADPDFASRPAGDYRPFVTSPAVNAGRADATANLDRIPYDFKGNLIGRADGVCSLGCHQSGFPYRVQFTAALGGLELSGAILSNNVFEIGDVHTISVSANDSGARKPIGIDVTYADATVERILFADLPGGVWTKIVSGAADTFAAVAVYGPWYIDCENGLDTNSGADAGHARKTFKSVMTDPLLIAGDIVYVLPGIYDDEADFMLDPQGIYTYSRLVVPAGVTVKSTGGKAVTEIHGANSPIPQTSYKHANDGCGTNAVRCVYLGSGARLEGFTLKNGRTFEDWDILPTANKNDYYGAAVHAPDSSAIVADCEIRDCKGGCIIRRITAYRTAFNDNGRHGGNTVHYATVRNCLVFGCIDGSAMAETSVAYNSLIACRDGYQGVAGGNCIAYNSLLLGHADYRSHYTNCVFATNATYKAWSSGSTYQSDANCDNCILTSVAGLGVGADWKPVKGSLPLDRGSDAYVAETEDDVIDVDGVPRILGSAVDVGPYEYDWRVDFAAMLGRRLVCTRATGGVVLDAGCLSVPAGATVCLAAGSGSNDVKVDLPVTLDPGAELSVSRNGVPVMTLTADGNIRLEFTDPDDVYEFNCSGSGAAQFHPTKSLNGFVIDIR